MKGLRTIYPVCVFLSVWTISVWTAYASPSGNNCQKLKSICVRGAETRMIGGKSIYRQCWQWQDTYSCDRNTVKDFCLPLAQKDDCTLSDSSCIESESSICTVRQNRYSCKSPLSPLGSNITLQADRRVITKDRLKSTCLSLQSNPQCQKTQDSQCVEGYGTRTINGLAITKDCWRWQTSYQCVGKSQNDCEKLHSRADCTFSHDTVISRDAKGNATYTEKVFTCKGGKRFAPDSKVCDSGYSFAGIKDTHVRGKNTDFAKAATFMNILQRASKDKDMKVKRIFLGENRTCSKTIASSLFFNCCSDDGLLPAIGLVHCGAEQVDLQNRLQSGQAKYVGSYCNDEIPILGICLRKSKSYCVFKSKLARIIHEQGRPQLGIDWGSPVNPNCRGFTLAELRQLDFSQIDLSEFLRDTDVIEQKVLQQNTQQDLQQRIQDYYSRQGGNQ